jgi:dipeptidyl aminopeptidase/acylaminoacyl peptidase
MMLSSIACQGMSQFARLATPILLLAFSCFASQTQAADLSAETMWQLKRLGAPAIAPDGRLAVVPVTTYDIEKNAGLTDLWLVPTKPGKARQLTSNEASDTSPAWSPNGELIAFVSKRGDDKEPQLYVIPVAGGEARRVTNVPTGVMAPKWFPDSRRIAFLSRVWPEAKSWAEQAAQMERHATRKMTAQVWDKAPISYWDRYLDGRETHIYAVSLEGGEPQAITFGRSLPLDAADPDTSSYDIAPDGSEVAFVADTDASGVDPNFDVFVMPLESGEPRNITSDNPANDTSPLYSPDGRLLAFRRQTLKDFYADRAQLMLFDRRSAQVRSLTEDWDRSADGLVWAPDSASLFGSIEDSATLRIYRFNVSGGAPQPITRDRSFSSLAVAGSGPVIVGLRQSFTEPPTLVSIIPRTGAATKLTDFNDTVLANVKQGKVESVTYTGANGADIQMWVAYPPNFTPERKWPLFLLLHGGPHSAINDIWQWRWNAQVFASWGYVTAWHNFHGSSGFGQAFTDSITKEWGELPYQDTLKAAEWFAAKPWIDGNRMAAGGGSYGGYLASYLLGREHPFQTLIAHAAVYNLYTQYATDDGAIKKRHGEFWEDFERFNRNSPHTNAANFKTPTLVIHGQADLRVPVNHGIELFNTLQNQGVPSKFVLYSNENHWILQPQNSLFWYDTVRKWLEKYVAPGPGEPAAAPEPAAAH